jgi:hypothetical protein
MLSHLSLGIHLYYRDDGLVAYKTVIYCRFKNILLGVHVILLGICIKNNKFYQ